MAGPSYLTGPLHIDGAVGVNRIALPGMVGDADIATDAAIASKKIIQRINVTRGDSTADYARTRTYCLADNINYCHLLAFGAWQNEMPTEGTDYVKYLLYAYRGSMSTACLQTELRLYGTDAPKTIKWGAVANPIGEPIYLTAGYSLWLVRTQAASGAANSGNGSGVVLVYDEYPMRGGIKTQFGNPVGYG